MVMLSHAAVRREAKLIYNSDQLLKLIHDSKALSIWNRSKGPVFWYIAGIPGPFYVNTEWMLGGECAAKLLGAIDAILATEKTGTGRAAQLKAAILAAYVNNSAYRNIVATMIERGQKEFPGMPYTFISGGERRDWLFSIPFAEECRLKHVFLFKDMSVHCEQPLKPPETGLHVSDLINNAASYFELWFPALEKARLLCVGTLCVNSRGDSGIQKLAARGHKAVALNHIDLAFFEQSLANGLINKVMLEEIACYFASPKEWAAHYLMNKSDLFNIEKIDKKSFERLQSFFANDPWSLRKDYQDFFALMQKKIAARVNNQTA